jgi:hypothetical protein
MGEGNSRDQHKEALSVVLPRVYRRSRTYDHTTSCSSARGERTDLAATVSVGDVIAIAELTISCKTNVSGGGPRF